MPEMIRTPIAADSRQSTQGDTPGSFSARDPAACFEYITRTADAVLQGRSLNAINRAVITRIAEEARSVSQAAVPIDQQRAQRMDLLMKVLLFAVSNQNYCSPSAKRAGAVHQTGLIRFSDKIKYLRSEVNTPIFGEAYDRNVVMIRAQSADAFRELSALYLVHSPSKVMRIVAGLSDNQTAGPCSQGHMLALEGVKGYGDLQSTMQCFLESSCSKTFEGGIYVRLLSPLSSDERTSMQRLLSPCRFQLLLEEPFDPCRGGISPYRRITFLHDGTDPRRYQLLQDAASMGFRPSLDDIVRYAFECGVLTDLLNLDGKTEDGLPPCPFTEVVEAGSEEQSERERDYGVLLATLRNSAEVLMSLSPQDDVLCFMKELLSEAARDIEGKLTGVLCNPQSRVKESVETFHQAYYGLRTVVQYAAFLWTISGQRSIGSLERAAERIEGGIVIATNCGMSASRTVIAALHDRVETAYTSAHYWETDFLIENIFSPNPHYPDVSHRTETRMQQIHLPASPQDVNAFAQKILAENSACSAGQLVCLDRTVSPFFYTKTFDLSLFCRVIADEGSRVENPLYLVVDSTVDLHALPPKVLFPQGIPKNVFLVYTPSFAKLHQLGLDIVTGGMINIHSHPEDSPAALRLAELLRTRLDAEGSRQSAYAQKVIEETYYAHHSKDSIEDYVRYMVHKRQRNASELVSGIARVLGHAADCGVLVLTDRRSGSEVIGIRDPHDERARHEVTMRFHYDTESRMHAYLQVLEQPGSHGFIAGRLFEAMKRSIFTHAAADGIHLSDGTSWGFPQTRLDWYMHTMRIAVGLEHYRTLLRLGTICGAVMAEFLDHPHEFVAGTQVLRLEDAHLRDGAEKFLALERLIPHDPSRPTPIEWYRSLLAGKKSFSFVVQSGEQLHSMLVAYERMSDGEPEMYLAKAVTHPDGRGRGYFRRMLQHVKAHCLSEGLHRIVLETSASKKNEPVVHAYERCGFRVSRLRGEFLSNGWPLILATMELDTMAPPSAALTPFTGIEDDMYEQIFRSKDLAPLQSRSGPLSPGN